jgi:hypothetical protein
MFAQKELKYYYDVRDEIVRKWGSCKDPSFGENKTKNTATSLQSSSNETNNCLNRFSIIKFLKKL